MLSARLSFAFVAFKLKDLSPSTALCSKAADPTPGRLLCLRVWWMALSLCTQQRDPIGQLVGALQAYMHEHDAKGAFRFSKSFCMHAWEFGIASQGRDSIRHAELSTFIGGLAWKKNHHFFLFERGKVPTEQKKTLSNALLGHWQWRLSTGLHCKN